MEGEFGVSEAEVVEVERELERIVIDGDTAELHYVGGDDHGRLRKVDGRWLIDGFD
jgi:hypothetical protein